MKIEVSTINAGIYILKVIEEESTATKKFGIQ
ncbi:T9SS type A sorting domain-containing protein [uncultured Polaribacter sp.]